MPNNKLLADIKEIKDIMNRSSRFNSLSGLSGIIAGFLALGGAYFAYDLINFINPTCPPIKELIFLALCVLTLSIGSGIFFSYLRAKKVGEKIWNHQAVLVIINMSIPLITGGILIMVLLKMKFFVLISPIMLIFYGLALVNTSKYTLSEMRSLGIIEIILGLLAAFKPNWGLMLWAGGFGLLHIIYGFWMYQKHEK